MPLVNECYWTAASAGTGSFVVSAAKTGFFTPAQCTNPAIVDGGTYHYRAESADLTEHEIGTGVYTASTTTLTRATVLQSSNSGSAVNFTAAPNVRIVALKQDFYTLNSGETVTASTPLLDLTQTWNNGAVTFTGIKSNITSTNSASGSLLLDLQVGSSTKFNVDKSGNVSVPSGAEILMAGTGTATDPLIKFTASGAGNEAGLFYYPSGLGVVIAAQGTAAISLGFGFIRGGSLAQIGWSSSQFNPDSIGFDTSFTRAAAATIQLGPSDVAAPVAQGLQVQSVIAGTSNTAGKDWSIVGSKGTGTGAGGNILFKTAPAGTTGTSQNAAATAFTVSSDGTIRPKAFTVSTLPTAGTVGRQAYITDGDAGLAWGATAANTGAGATKYMVWDNGTNWTVMGK